MEKLSQLAERFKEPSSWAGLAGLASILGVNLDPGLSHSIALVGAGIAGLIAFFVPEKGTK